MTTREWLEVVVIPLVLVLIAAVWPMIQNWHRCRTFTRLIFRELEEIGPHFSEDRRADWTEHLTKNFVHRKILKEISQNRDFILSLNPDLVYYLTQLWDAYDEKNHNQWLYYLEKLVSLETNGKLKKVHADWAKTLINAQ